MTVTIGRREFLVVLGGGAPAWPLAARAQQPVAMRRIGVLIGVADDTEGQARLWAFRRGLQALGWTEGRNVHIVARFAPSNSERQTYAAELVRLTPDVILANTTVVVQALLRETKTIPIVFAQLPDPVAVGGLVSNLARPGGNITGFISFERPKGGKWLDLLKETAPSVSRTLVIGGDTSGTTLFSSLPPYMTAIKEAAVHHRMQLTSATLSFYPLSPDRCRDATPERLRVKSRACPIFIDARALADPASKELAARKKKWKAPEPRYSEGILVEYARHVSSASKGAIADAHSRYSLSLWLHLEPPATIERLRVKIEDVIFILLCQHQGRWLPILLKNACSRQTL